MLGCLLSLLLCAAPLELPRAVDNSTKKYFPPVFNQIGGSCAQASTIGYMLTYELCALRDADASLPENRMSYLFSWNQINDGTDTGSISWDGINLAIGYGIMSEADFPPQFSAYQFRWASGFDAYVRAMCNRARRMITLDAEDCGLDAIREYLYGEGRGHLLVFSSAAGGWKFDDSYDGPSETGYHSVLTSLPTSGAHAMTIVGYDDSIECNFDGRVTQGAFIVVNSYGDSWRDRGRYYLPYRFFEDEVPEEAIFSKSLVGVEAMQAQEPSLVYKVGVDYSSRNDLHFCIGAADKPYSERPASEVLVRLANNAGGDLPMAGSGAGSSIELAFNADALKPALENFREPKYFLQVHQSPQGKLGEGRLTCFEVHDLVTGEVWTLDESCAPFVSGANYYGIPTTPLIVTSASPVEWFNNKSGQPAKVPFVVRTAKGRFAKVRFSDYGDGRLTIKYVYSKDGRF